MLLKVYLFTSDYLNNDVLRALSTTTRKHPHFHTQRVNRPRLTQLSARQHTVMKGRRGQQATVYLRYHSQRAFDAPQAAISGRTAR